MYHCLPVLGFLYSFSPLSLFKHAYNLLTFRCGNCSITSPYLLAMLLSPFLPFSLSPAVQQYCPEAKQLITFNPFLGGL